MTNIYEQQYQMGLFVREHYNGAGVAANDIGALNYLGDVRILDLDGLASLPVARFKRGTKWAPGPFGRSPRRRPHASPLCTTNGSSAMG